MKLSSLPFSLQHLTFFMSLGLVALITPRTSLAQEEGPPSEIIVNAIAGQPIDFPLQVPTTVTDIGVSGLPQGIVFDTNKMAIVGPAPAEPGSFTGSLNFKDNGEAGSIPLKLEVYTEETFPGNPDNPPSDEGPQALHINAVVGYELNFPIFPPSDATGFQTDELPNGFSFDSVELVFGGTPTQAGEFHANLFFLQNGQKQIPIVFHVFNEVDFQGDPNNPNLPPPNDDPNAGDPNGGTNELVVNAIVGHDLQFDLPLPPDATDLTSGDLPDGLLFLSGALSGSATTPGAYPATVFFNAQGASHEFHYKIQVWTADNFPGDINNPNQPPDGDPNDGGDPNNGGDPTTGGNELIVNAIVGLDLQFNVPLPPDATDVSSGELPAGLSFQSGALTGSATTPGTYPATVFFNAQGQSHEFHYKIQVWNANEFQGDVNNPNQPPQNGDPNNGGAADELHIKAVVGFELKFLLEPDENITDIVPGTLPDGLSYDANIFAIVGTPTTEGDSSTTFAFKEAGIDKTIPVHFHVFLEEDFIGDPNNPNPPPQDGNPNGGQPTHVFAFVGQDLYFEVLFDVASSTIEYLTNPDGTAGGLPTGIALDATENAFIGVPETPGFFNVSFTVTNATGTHQENFVFEFQPQGGDPTGGFIPAIYVVGNENQELFFQIFLPEDWTDVSIEYLPEGIVFDSEQMAFTGTPATAGQFQAFVTAKRGEEPQSVVVNFDIFGEFDGGGPATGGEQFWIHGFVGQFLTFGLPYDLSQSGVALATLADGTTAKLPEGVTLDADNGLFVGYPQKAGFFDSEITVTEGENSRNVPVHFEIQVFNDGGPHGPGPAPQHDDRVTLFGQVGTRFAFKFGVQEGQTIELPTETATGQTFGLPTGLAFDATANAIVGSPTESGVFESLVVIANADGSEAKRMFLLFLVSDANGAPKLSFYQEAEYPVGTEFTFPIQAAGSPTEFAIEGLPEGVSINAITGNVSGNASQDGQYDLIVRASNDAGDAYGMLYLDFYFDHDEGNGEEPPPTGEEDSDDPEPFVGRVGVPFLLEAPAEYANSAFALVDGESFPAGIGFDAARNAVISGTPTEAGYFETKITITTGEIVESFTLSFFIADSVAAPQFVSGDYIRVRPGETFELPLRVANGPATITIRSDSEDITFDATSRSIKGALSQPGFYTVLAFAENDNGLGALLIDIDVFDDGSGGVPIGGEVMPITMIGIVGEPLNFPLPADPSRSQLAIVDGPDGQVSTIPDGLSYLPTYALIKGNPTTEGEFHVYLDVTEFGFTRHEHIIFKIYTRDNVPEDAFPTDPNQQPDDGHVEPILGKVGERLYFEAPISGDNVSFAIVAGPDGEESVLPPGIEFDAELGILSGVPTKSGIYPLWVKVDEDGHVSTHFAPLLISGPIGSPEITSSDYIATKPDTVFTHTVTATNSPTKIAIDLGDLPGALSFDEATATLKGKFTFGGFYTVLITAENATGIGYGLLNIDVLGINYGDGGTGALPPPDIPLQINGTVDKPLDYPLPSFIRGSSFQVAVDPSGKQTEMPTGLTLDPKTGRVSGTPTVGGFRFVYVKVDDGALPSLALNIGIAMGQPKPKIVSPDHWFGNQGAPFQYVIAATDFPTKFYADNLPAGLALNETTGNITGTPTGAGNFEIPLAAENKAGKGEPRTLFLTISEKPKLPVVSAPKYTEVLVGSELSIQATATENPDFFHATGLPAGLLMDPDTGLISGAPLQDGYFNVRVEAFNQWGKGSINIAISIKRPALAPYYFGPTNLGGKVGQAFSVILGTRNEVTSYAVDDDSPNPLPAGLTLNSGNGQITGAPTATFNGYVTFKISGPGGVAKPNVFIKIVPALDAPVITSSPLAKGTAGKPFTFTLTASNNPVEFSAVNLPEGLSLEAATGVISGTPTNAGYIDIKVAARNDAGWGVARLMILDIVRGLDAPMITSAPYAKGEVGKPFSYQATASNAPTGFEVVGDLPAGLSLDPTSGLISGTPTAAGVTELMLVASNASGKGNGMVFFIAIKPSLDMPKVTSSGTAFAKVGEPFVYRIIATGTPTSYSADNLPDWLTLDESTGFISGTPTEPTEEPIILIVYASNAAGKSLPRGVFLEVQPAAEAPVIVSGGYAIGKVGDEFQFQVHATNEPTSYLSPELPQGLSLDSQTGLISGTPEKAGEFEVSLQATNDAGTGEPAVLAIFILPSADMPKVTSAPSAFGKVGEEFSYQILASTEEIDSYQVDGTLPRGLDFDPITGLISGSPVEPIIAVVGLSATNSAGTSLPQPLTIKIQPSIEAPVVISSLQAKGIVGQDFSYTIEATNMPEDRPLPPNAELDAVGLPAGLGVNAATGIISGTPTEAGFFVVTLVATNAAGEGNPKFLALTIAPAPEAPKITSPAKVSAQVGISFSYQILATNTPTSYDAEHSITWLATNTETGALSGTPTKPGVYTAALFASNDAGESNAAPLEITVYPAANTPKITSVREATGKVGNAFSYQIEATNTPTSYTVSGLPAGLSLNATTGEISGTPSASGTFEIVMLASNANGQGTKTILKLEISPRTEIIITF